MHLTKLSIFFLSQCFLSNSFSPLKNNVKPFTANGSNVLQRRMAIEPISLDSLGEDHASVGTKMKESIVSWLDAEWIPQEVHIQMASSAENTYITCRESGEDDIAEIMLKVVDNLNDDWKKFDKDAFVNAWDIGNYVADYLSNRA